MAGIVVVGYFYDCCEDGLIGSSRLSSKSISSSEYLLVSIKVDGIFLCIFIF